MSSYSLYYLCKWYSRQAPLKMFLKSPHSSTKWPSSLIYYGWTSTEWWDKYFTISRWNKGTPHLTFMRRAKNADTHAFKQHQLPQNSSSCAPVFHWLSHLTLSWSPKAKNGWKMLIYTPIIMSRNKQHLFSIFTRIPISWPESYFL